KKSCVCLSVGMVFGLCLAGIFFYASLPKEEYRSNSKNLMKIMGLEALQNKTQNKTSGYYKLAQKTEHSRFPSTAVSLKNTAQVIPEADDETDETE
ncbi:hypothetical protein KR054_001416, partial [Drosophila jambulina]